LEKNKSQVNFNFAKSITCCTVVPSVEANIFLRLPSLDETKKSGRRLIGDVHFVEARKRASWITPVPGGT